MSYIYVPNSDSKDRVPNYDMLWFGPLIPKSSSILLDFDKFRRVCETNIITEMSVSDPLLKQLKGKFEKYLSIEWPHFLHVTCWWPTLGGVTRWGKCRGWSAADLATWPKTIICGSRSDRKIYLKYCKFHWNHPKNTLCMLIWVERDRKIGKISQVDPKQ